MEGAVLKKRFDDIFDSTRYVKALEEIKDQKKIYSNKVKELKAELNLLKGHKHAAQGFRNVLDDCKHQLSLIMDEMKDYEEKMNQERETLKELQEEVRKGDDLQASIDEIGNKIDNETVRIETQKNGLQTDFTESKTRQELENVLKGFGKSMETDARDLKAANDHMHAIQNRIDSLKQKQMDLLTDKGKLEGEKSVHESNLQSRIDLMEEIATKYGLELTFSQTQQADGINTQGSLIHDDDGMSVFTSHTSGSSSSIQITNEDLDAFERSVQVKRSQLEEQLAQHREMSQIAEDNVQNELSELNGKIKSMENGKLKIACCQSYLNS
jgi:DNA repair protein RAD50